VARHSLLTAQGYSPEDGNINMFVRFEIFTAFFINLFFLGSPEYSWKVIFVLVTYEALVLTYVDRVYMAPVLCLSVSLCDTQWRPLVG
jgi:hypothetical protein